MSRRIRLLIDECLHTSLVKMATDRLYEAYHVAHLGMIGFKDHQLMPRIRDENFTLVTNNAIDFRRLFQKEDIHAGLIIIVPNTCNSACAARGRIGLCWRSRSREPRHRDQPDHGWHSYRGVRGPASWPGRSLTRLRSLDFPSKISAKPVA